MSLCLYQTCILCRKKFVLNLRSVEFKISEMRKNEDLSVTNLVDLNIFLGIYLVLHY